LKFNKLEELLTLLCGIECRVIQEICINRKQLVEIRHLRRVKGCTVLGNTGNYIKKELKIQTVQIKVDENRQTI
jgi:hypothetical protein